MINERNIHISHVYESISMNPYVYGFIKRVGVADSVMSQLHGSFISGL